jgi:hypothetical protein
MGHMSVTTARYATAKLVVCQSKLENGLPSIRQIRGTVCVVLGRTVEIYPVS